MTPGDASDSVGCTTTMDAERLLRLRWCQCGQPWIPATGLYGTTEETECAACVLRRVLAAEREQSVHRCKGAAALLAVEICGRYAHQHPEHAEAAQHIAVQIVQETRK